MKLMHMKKGPVQKPGVLMHMTPKSVDGESTPQVRVLTPLEHKSARDKGVARRDWSIS